MNYEVATKWSELTDWQLEELAYLLLSHPNPPKGRETEAETERLFMIIRFLFQKDNSAREQWRFARLINEVPISTLVEYAAFLNGMPDLFRFPDLSAYGVMAPGDRLNNITMKQFSVADAIFYKWRETEDELCLRQLVASLYVIDGFDVLKLPEVAEKTDAVPLKKMYAVGLTYLAVRNALTERFSVVFPKAKPQNDDAPVFRKSSYTPFSKVITAMAMDERQPLGNFEACKQTNIYEFFEVLTEAILRTN